MKPTRVCSVPGCRRSDRITRGYCNMHYARVPRHGRAGGPEPEHAVSYEGQECATPGCVRRPQSNGLCLLHYKRVRKHGDVHAVRRARTFQEAFDIHAKRGPDCWEWTGTIYNTGYGRIDSGRKNMLAHRWSYEHFNGPIPDGLVIDHLCRNRSCVNPDHLEAVTNIENLARGAGYGLRNGMRSTCINGHEYTEDNTYRHPRTSEIRCRECARIRDRLRSKNRKKTNYGG